MAPLFCSFLLFHPDPEPDGAHPPLRHRHGQRQRHRRAGPDHPGLHDLRHHLQERRGRLCARLHSARRALAGADPAHPDRVPRHVHQGVRAHHPSIRQHAGRPHRHLLPHRHGFDFRPGGPARRRPRPGHLLARVVRVASCRRISFTLLSAMFIGQMYHPAH
jgi:hypothetical protein